MININKKLSYAIDIIIESINYIIISYALSSMAMSFRTSFVYILFFTSNVWITTKFYSSLKETTNSTFLSCIIFAISFIIFVLIVYYVGYIYGTTVKFK